MRPKLSLQYEQIGEDYQALCRLCLEKTNLKIDVYQEEGLKRDIKKKILNCLSLIIAQDDNLPKFVCIGCVDKLENFQTFRDMCHESKNLLTTYISKMEKCNWNNQGYKSLRASSSSEHMNSGSGEKQVFSVSNLSPPQGPTPDFVNCSVKTELEEVPLHEEAVENTWKTEPSTSVKLELTEERMKVDEPGEVHESSTSDGNAQFGADVLEDSDNDMVEIEPQEVTKNELTIESEGLAIEGELCLEESATVEDGSKDEDMSNNKHSHLAEACEVSVPNSVETNLPQSRNASSTVVSPTVSFSMEDNTANVMPSKSDLVNNKSIYISKKSFYCSTCKIRYMTNKSFKNHLKIHSGEGPFICSTCSKVFSEKEMLKRHSRIHTEQFVCLACHKSFPTRELLNEHYRMVTVISDSTN